MGAKSNLTVPERRKAVLSLVRRELYMVTIRRFYLTVRWLMLYK